LSLSSVLFRRKLFDELGEFDESLPVGEDYDLGLELPYTILIIISPLLSLLRERAG